MSACPNCGSASFVDTCLEVCRGPDRRARFVAEANARSQTDPVTDLYRAAADAYAAFLEQRDLPAWQHSIRIRLGDALRRVRDDRGDPSA